MKKLLSWISAVAMLTTMLSVFTLSVAAETRSGDYTYTLALDSPESGYTATITQYSGTATDVVIPSEIDGYPVTEIGQGAFQYMKALRSVTIPESVKVIGEDAFLFCISLMSAELPSGLESIGENAFRSTCLLSVDVPDGVTRIGAGAFAYCRGLSNVHIPSSVESIGDYAFVICARLESVMVDADNRNYSSADGVLYNKDQTELICCPSGKKGVYTVPDSVEILNEYGFMGLVSLEGVVVPENSKIMSAEDGVLFNKDKTELICYPGGKSDSSYAIPNGVESIDAYAFSVCENLLHITIPGSVETIGGRVFLQCLSLQDAIIEEGVKRVCGYAFELCEELRSVTLPHSIETIDWQAFSQEGYRLKTVYFDGTEKEWEKVNGRNEFSRAEVIFLKTEQDDFIPQNLQASTATTGIVVSWDAVDGAFEYRLYRLNDEGQWQTVKTLYHGETEYLVTGLTAGKSYTFTVQAYRVDPETGEELWSSYDKTGVTATATFGAPVVTVSTEGMDINVSWPLVEGATGYRIYRQANDGSWRTVAVADDKTTTFTDETAVPNVYYLYAVQACTVEDGKTVYSSYEINGAFARVTLGTPTMNSAVVTEDGVIVSWSTVENATGYRLYRQTEDGWKTIKTLKGEDATSFTDKSSYAGVGSVYTVQAFYATDGVVVWSGYDVDGESGVV